MVATLTFLAAAMGTGATVGVVTSPPASAEPITDCSTTVGVIVVVDFSPWGGNVERGCAADPSGTTGYEAMNSVGFTTSGDEHDGPGFVCRITDPATGVADPTPSQDPCVDTPPASAYWSYWWADNGQTSWTFSQQGAMDDEPQPGSTQAWVFGAGTPPPFSVAQVEATNTTPSAAPTTTTSTGPGSAPTSAPVTTSVAGPATSSPPAAAASGAPHPAASTGSSGGSPGASPGKSPAAAPAAASPTSAPQSGAGTGPTSGASTGGAPSVSPGTGHEVVRGRSRRASAATPALRVLDVPTVATRSAPSGSPIALVVGVAVVVAVGAAAGALAWRRRRSSVLESEIPQ